MSRYSTKPGAIFKRESLTYYVLSPAPELGLLHNAYDSTTSALLASAETLEELENKLYFLGYMPQQKEPKL